MKTNPLVDKDTEKEIVKMRKKGLSMSDIASELNLSEKTVRKVSVLKKCTDKDFIEQRIKKMEKLIADGLSKKEIMKKLKITEHQYRRSLEKIKKTNDEERLEIANKARERYIKRNEVILPESDDNIPSEPEEAKTEKKVSSNSRKEKIRTGLETILRMLIVIIKNNQGS